MPASFFVKVYNFVQPCGHVGKERIQNGDGCHCLNDHHGTRDNHRIVTPFDGYFDFLAVLIDCLLSGSDGRGWLDGCPEDERGTVTYAAQRSAGMVGCFCNLAVPGDKGIVIGKTG